MAIEEGPKAIGPMYGYGLTTKDLKKIYIRNGFEHLEIINRHVTKWTTAGMAYRILDSVVFFLDVKDMDDAEAYRRLKEHAQKSGCTDDDRIVGWMS